jgi:Domain of unknown function (DUF5916)/Carbohydrate family 9 binding domain-like
MKKLTLTLLSLTCFCLAAARAQTPAAQPAASTTAQAAVAPADGPAAASPAAPAPDPSRGLPAEKQSPVRVARFGGGVVVDGKLDEEVWVKAARLRDFYQVRPGDNISPSKPTEVLIGYDDKFLYLGFRATDDPEKVRATVAKRDGVFDDDHVSVYLDTYNDKRKAYYLSFNPHGVQADAIYTEGSGEDFSVDIVMESRGSITPEGYVVEVKIPFKSLRYEAGEGKAWGIHFFRRIKRLNNEEDSWMPLSRDRSGLLAQAGQAVGFDGISRGHVLEIIPSLTVSEAGRRTRAVPRAALASDPTLLDPGRFVNSPVELDPGVTVKFGITPTVTLDFAVNPDFAQVEADATVVTANQRFPIFFEEKRPFFLEGIDIFNTPLRVVHTRTIVDPDAAVKLTGKQGRNTFGLMYASDNAPGNFSEDERTDPFILPEIGRFLDKNAHVGVLRLKRDVGRESSIGMIATTRNFVGEHNHVGGIDGRLRVDERSFFSFQVLGTATRLSFLDRDGEETRVARNGFGYSYNYDRAGRHFSYRLSGSGRSPGYRADVGFTRRTNTNQSDFFVRYGSEPNPQAKLISWSAYNSFRPAFDWQGRMQNWANESQVSLELRRQTSLGFGLTGGYERLFAEEFGGFAGPDSERSTYQKSVYAFGSSTPSKKYSFFLLGIYTSGAYDFDFGAGRRFPRVSPAALLNPGSPLDPGPGTQFDLNGSFTYRPTSALRTSLEYTRSRLTRHDTDRVAFEDNIFAFRATYQFTRFTFARARVDYDSLTSRLTGQYLLGWTPNPGTAFYVGYNDDLNRHGFSPFTGQHEPGFRRNGRTFFIKLSYLFRRTL